MFYSKKLIFVLFLLGFNFIFSQTLEELKLEAEKQKRLAEISMQMAQSERKIAQEQFKICQFQMDVIKNKMDSLELDLKNQIEINKKLSNEVLIAKSMKLSEIAEAKFENQDSLQKNNTKTTLALETSRKLFSIYGKWNIKEKFIEFKEDNSFITKGLENEFGKSGVWKEINGNLYLNEKLYSIILEDNLLVILVNKKIFKLEKK